MMAAGGARPSRESIVDESLHAPGRYSLAVAKPEQPVSASGRNLDLEIVAHGVGRIGLMPALALPFSVPPLRTVGLRTPTWQY